jgi:hypothetical protein
MELHDEAIVHAHARHLAQHVGHEARGIIRQGLAAQRALEDRIGFDRGEPFHARAVGADIGGGRAKGLEVRALFFECLSQPGASMFTTLSGRKVGTILPFQPEARIA